MTKMAKRVCEDCDQSFAPDMMANTLRCRGCHRAKLRAARVEKTYSITEAQYQQLLAAQGHACYICRRKAGYKRHSVDHDHACCNGPISCGKCVRGLLCNTCNKYLGHIRDNVEAGYRVGEYLRQPPARDVLATASSS